MPSTLNTIDTTFGAAFIGLVCSAVMYGLTLLQTYTYYRSYPNDSWRLKSMVFILWLLDSLHLILCTIAIYWYLVRNFDDRNNLGITHWSMNLQTDCNGLIGLMVELFFAQRVWKISRSYIITGFISVLAFMHFSLGVYFTIQAFLLKQFSKYSQLTWVTSAGLGGAAAADIMIATSLVFFLSRNKTGFEKTDSLITTLMLYAINTGLLTSICATAAVICFAIMPLNFIWLSFFWCLGKLYVNSLLASLNSREKLRERVLPSENTFVNLTDGRRDGIPMSPQLSAHHRFSRVSNQIPRQLSIKVETTKEQASDFFHKEEQDEPGSPHSAVTFLSAQNALKSPSAASFRSSQPLIDTHAHAYSLALGSSPPATSSPRRSTFRRSGGVL